MCMLVSRVCKLEVTTSCMYIAAAIVSLSFRCFHRVLSASSCIRERERNRESVLVECVRAYIVTSCALSVHNSEISREKCVSSDNARAVTRVQLRCRLHVSCVICRRQDQQHHHRRRLRRTTGRRRAAQVQRRVKLITEVMSTLVSASAST